MTGIEIHLWHLAPDIGQKYLNILKSALYIKKSVVNQVIILNKSVMTRKKSLITDIPNIRHE